MVDMISFDTEQLARMAKMALTAWGEVTHRHDFHAHGTFDGVDTSKLVAESGEDEIWLISDAKGIYLTTNAVHGSMVQAHAVGQTDANPEWPAVRVMAEGGMVLVRAEQAQRWCEALAGSPHQIEITIEDGDPAGVSLHPTGSNAD